MLNYETAGSELLKVTGDPTRSTADIIINEDYTIIVKVISVENGIVEGVKVWDQGDTRFFAVLKYHGKAGTPEDSELEAGEYILFHRVGEFTNKGTEGFELHEEDVLKCSWVCFLDNKKTIWVTDNGDGTGTYKGKTLPLKPSDPLSSYYNNEPPWLEGRVFLGQETEGSYVVFISGVGEGSKSFSSTAGDVIWTLGVDNAGKIVSFTAEDV